MSIFDPANPQESSDDDFVTRGQARKEALQTLADISARSTLEKAYFDVKPSHREVQGEVYRAWGEFVQTHPDKHQALFEEAKEGKVGSALSEAFFAISDAVDKRIASAARREQPREGERTVRPADYEPSDDHREQALREEEARYLRTKQPLG